MIRLLPAVLAVFIGIGLTKSGQVTIYGPESYSDEYCAQWIEKLDEVELHHSWEWMRYSCHADSDGAKEWLKENFPTEDERGGKRI